MRGKDLSGLRRFSGWVEPRSKHTSFVLDRTMLVSLLIFGFFLVSIILAQGCLLAAEIGQLSSDSGIQTTRMQIMKFEFLGEVVFPTGYQFQHTEVGGLSGITYHPQTNRFYAISDDRSRINPARIYSLTIDLKNGLLDPGDLVFTGVITLLDGSGKPFRRNHIDPEGIAITNAGEFYISSEGDIKKRIAPFVNGFDANGKLIRELTIPMKYLPSPKSGIRNNLSFESLAITPDQCFLFTAVENALLQDGPAAKTGKKSMARILKYDLKRGDAVAEYVYPVAGVPQAHQILSGSWSNGLVELLVLDDESSLLALERGYSMATGAVVKLFHVALQDATDVIAEFSLLANTKNTVPKHFSPVQKKELLDMSELVSRVDNLEGMTFGPDLPDGRRTLIMVSDNNFSSVQKTQFIALALTFLTDIPVQNDF